MLLQTGHLYEFGEFRLDPVERVITRSGKSVALTPKAFHLLAILVENHGHIVEKEKLMSEIWADSFVEEGNLAVNARMLRKVLGDDASSPKFIETVPRRGYRFIADVKEIEAEAVTDRANPPVKSNDTSRRFAVTAFVVIMIGLATSMWFARGSLFAGPEAPILSAPFKSSNFSNTGNVPRAVISPDGNKAAYVEIAGENQSLWLRDLGTGESREIIAPSRDYYFGLTFSSDGQNIFYSRRGLDGHQMSSLYRVAVTGGIPAKISDGALNSLSPSPDNKQIAFVRCAYKRDDNCSLLVADIDGTNERKIVSQPAPGMISTVQFSPDGRSVSFAHGDKMSGTSDFRISSIDLATGVQSEIVPQRFYEIESLHWLPEGDKLLFTVRQQEDGPISVWKASLNGGDAVVVLNEASSYQEISLDNKGEKMIATKIANDYQMFSGEGKNFTPLAAARNITIASDGKIVYSTFEGDLWTVNRNGGERRQLTSGPAGDQVPRVSPDGRSIYFKSDRAGGTNVWRMNADGTDPVMITKQTSGGPVGFSADGQTLFFTRSRNLFRVSKDGGDETLVSNERVLRLECSPDGSRAAYFILDGGFKIAILRTSDGSVEKIFPLPDQNVLPQRLTWTHDSRSISYAFKSKGRNLLWQQEIDGAAPTEIADLGADEVIDLAMMPDGKGFVFVRGKQIFDAVVISGLK